MLQRACVLPRLCRQCIAEGVCPTLAVGPTHCSAVGVCPTTALRWGLGSVLQRVCVQPKHCGQCIAVGVGSTKALQWGLGSAVQWAFVLLRPTVGPGWDEGGFIAHQVGVGGLDCCG